ncbi:hypothetical protein CLOSTMETH_01887 [[Clostridium] methylpentosum DSM 5476]|uniref:Uncharacterized protein n=1 Tax=[Clostridium] methylpentosum DSM 5476 TaxID=537013 RepID=C0EDG0_9FIRM|nr:hypothetical protein CLOSTMETH_01887 [[Clostridium] methylpentosum DSM 5476]
MFFILDTIGDLIQLKRTIKMNGRLIDRLFVSFCCYGNHR